MAEIFVTAGTMDDVKVWLRTEQQVEVALGQFVQMRNEPRLFCINVPRKVRE